MERERWSRIKQVVNDCLDIERAARKAHIVEACEGDATLIAEVETLLASYDEAGEFLETPALVADVEETLTGRQIGPYQLCESIAEGGMGTVYRAVRASDFQKQVAIKLVKRGMDTDFILRRFRHERQILARLEHPNIARLLDGGATADGRPYLVMEYVEGTPITDYCEKHQLDSSERLRLFRMVCSAVQFAHQNLVVHRDLKPGNILVTPEGVPKLLDFGIAKLFEPDAEVTVASLRLMTPDCASPEQVRGDPITTATDIYSLGVLLYNLLTGERPYHFTTRTVEEITRVVCDTDPKRPSAVRHLPQDLDNIVLKAMHKEPARRYASVEQFSEDIRRYLTGLPVIARQDTFLYRASKFVRRHRTATAAAVLVALSLVGGMAATLWQARIATLERARAERRFNDTRELANSLMFEVHDAIRSLPGSTPARKLIVERALRYLDKLAGEESNDNSLRRELAAGYQKLGQVQGRSGSANLGDTAGAIASFRKALRLRQDVVNAEPSHLQDIRALAKAYDDLGSALSDSGNLKEMEECDRKALELRNTLAPRLSDVEAAKELLYSYYYLGLHSSERGDFRAGLQYYAKYLAACEKAAAADAGFRQSLSLGHKRIGALLIRSNELSRALDHYRTAQAIDEKLVAANPNDADGRMNLTFTYSDIGLIYWRRGDFGAALGNYRKALAIRSALAAADPQNERAVGSLATTYSKLGGLQWAMGDRKVSIEAHTKSLQLREQLMEAHPASIPDQVAVAYSSAELGDAYRILAEGSHEPADARLSLWRQARAAYRRSSEIVTRLQSQGPLSEDAQFAARQVAAYAPKCDAAISGLMRVHE